MKMNILLFLPQELIVLTLELSDSFDPMAYLLVSKDYMKTLVRVYSVMKVLKTSNLNFSLFRSRNIKLFPNVESLTIVTKTKYWNQHTDYKPIISTKLRSLDISRVRYYHSDIVQLTKLITHPNNIKHKDYSLDSTNLRELELKVEGYEDSIGATIPKNIVSLKLVGVCLEDGFEELCNLTSLNIDLTELSFGIPDITTLINLTINCKNTRNEEFRLNDEESKYVEVYENGEIKIFLPKNIKALTLYNANIYITSEGIETLIAYDSRLCIDCPNLNLLKVKECNYTIIRLKKKVEEILVTKFALLH